MQSEHNALRAASFPPLDGGADQAASLHTGRATRGDSQPPTPLDDDLRDALNDLVQENRLSALRMNDPKCPLGVCLKKHGYASWAPNRSPGRWVITQLGYRFLETRTIQSRETR